MHVTNPNGSSYHVLTLRLVIADCIYDRLEATYSRPGVTCRLWIEAALADWAGIMDAREIMDGLLGDRREVDGHGQRGGIA